MKRKQIVSIGLVLTMAAALFAGCGSASGGDSGSCSGSESGSADSDLLTAVLPTVDHLTALLES